MNKIKTLKVIIAGLILLNLVMTFIFLKPHPRPNKLKAEYTLRELFEFNDQQMDQFRASRDLHITQIKPLQEKLNDVAIKYYLLNDSMQKTASINDVLTITKQIYKVNEKHINDIKSMAGGQKSEQLEGFIKSLIQPKQKPPR